MRFGGVVSLADEASDVGKKIKKIIKISHAKQKDKQKNIASESFSKIETIYFLFYSKGISHTDELIRFSIARKRNMEKISTFLIIFNGTHVRKCFLKKESLVRRLSPNIFKTQGLKWLSTTSVCVGIISLSRSSELMKHQIRTSQIY